MNAGYVMNRNGKEVSFGVAIVCLVHALSRNVL